MKVDQRHPKPHGLSESNIISVIGIRTPVPVSKKSLRGEGIVVRASHDCRYSQRQVGQDPRLEYSLGAHQRNPFAPENKALLQKRPGEHVALAVYLLAQPVEGCQPNLLILDR